MDEMTLVIRTVSGSILDIAYENEKGWKKSLERGELWCLHPDTKRLLPYEEFGRAALLVTIEKKNAWYEAVLETGTKTGTSMYASTGEDRPSAAPVALSGDAGGSGEVLETLAAVIHGRKMSKPEGSYTTHLFESGEEKVRKKTGEEAIELVLARSSEELVHEAADFIYHMLVLLEIRSIPLSSVLDELRQRSR